MLTQNFMHSLEDWQKEGERCVRIELDSLNPWQQGPRIWVYDYSVSSGMYLSPGQNPPTLEELKEIKRKRLQRELLEL